MQNKTCRTAQMKCLECGMLDWKFWFSIGNCVNFGDNIFEYSIYIHYSIWLLIHLVIMKNWNIIVNCFNQLQLLRYNGLTVIFKAINFETGLKKRDFLVLEVLPMERIYHYLLHKACKVNLFKNDLLHWGVYINHWWYKLEANLGSICL